MINKMKILIKNGRVIDPGNNTDRIEDVLVEDSRISRTGPGIKTQVDQVIDATDKIVMPGLVDMHVHLREPGREDKETIASATKAALKGGLTSVLAMPNTFPAIDSSENIELLKKIIHDSAQINVLIAGSITKGRLGIELSDLPALKRGGAIAITDDGSSVDSQDLMLKAFKAAKAQGLLVICHSEDKSLSNKGVVNQGLIATKLGLRGIPKEAEYQRVLRDIQLADKAQSLVHIAHVSCLESIEIIAQAKRKGIRVTAETAPHYFALDETEVCDYDANKKINPPLRTKEDVKAVIQGLKDNTIDVVASDHAPHTESEKEIEFDYAEFGTVGLETTLAVGITALVHNAGFSWLDLAKKYAFNPARILGIKKGALTPGSDADIIIVDPQREWVVKRQGLISKSKNSVFLNKTLKGIVECSLYSGKVLFRSNAA
jgi:dihydroorotase